jgi:hypothetical protein
VKLGGDAGQNFDRHAADASRGARIGRARTGTGADVTESGERRKNPALRRRIEKLIGRVHEARAEIVERGLDAVHDAPDRDADDEPRHPPDAGTADVRA